MAVFLRVCIQPRLPGRERRACGFVEGVGARATEGWGGDGDLHGHGLHRLVLFVQRTQSSSVLLQSGRSRD